MSDAGSGMPLVYSEDYNILQATGDQLRTTLE
jgi:hypothetical protein